MDYEQKYKEQQTHLLIHMDVFYRDLLVIWGNKEQTTKSLAIYHESQAIDEMLEDFASWDRGRTVYSPSHNAFFVWMPERPKTAQDVGFLVHELFHSTYAVMCNIGINLSDDSEEAFAYMIGYLTEKVIETLPTFSCLSQ